VKRLDLVILVLCSVCIGAALAVLFAIATLPAPRFSVPPEPRGAERLYSHFAYRDPDGRFCMAITSEGRKEQRSYCWLAEEWMEDPK
jgi:hypothetical protein